MTSLLPFDVGYVSAMSDNEMLDLALELESSHWEEGQAFIEKTVSDYMEHVWRRGWGSSYMMPMSDSFVYRKNVPTPYATYTSRVISLHVPDALTERVARTLIEMQLREQIYGEYDPRRPDED